MDKPVTTAAQKVLGQLVAAISEYLEAQQQFANNGMPKNYARFCAAEGKLRNAMARGERFSR